PDPDPDPNPDPDPLPDPVPDPEPLTPEPLTPTDEVVVVDYQTVTDEYEVPIDVAVVEQNGDPAIYMDYGQTGYATAMASDLNHDGQLSDNEIIDITDDSVDMAQFSEQLLDPDPDLGDQDPGCYDPDFGCCDPDLDPLGDTQFGMNSDTDYINDADINGYLG
ncbi:MAG: hypothetical protein HUK03_05335, partial [Bacteroidaceae bacterium]|nr:hypothetical protein [Bacteroidaceae bacterium]